MIQQTIDLLGLRATDKVTGMSGVITSVSFDLYGCVCAGISPAAKDDGTLPTSIWFDVQRLEIADDRIMGVPQFREMARTPAEYNHGPADKAAPR